VAALGLAEYRADGLLVLRLRPAVAIAARHNLNAAKAQLSGLRRGLRHEDIHVDRA